MTMIDADLVQASGLVTERWSLRPDVRLEPDGSVLRLAHRFGGQALPSLSPALTAALLRISDGPADLDEVLDTLLESAGDADLARFHWLLDRLAGHCVRGIWAGDRQLAVAVPLVPRARFQACVHPAGPVRLSRFTYLRRVGDRLTAESPLSLFRVESTSPEAAAVLTGLAAGGGQLPGPSEVSAALTGLLIGTGMACVGEAEDDDDVLRQWSFHDLLFHSRSRMGRHDDEFGATFPFTGQIEPQPAVRSLPESSLRVPLPRPSLADLLRRDAPLTAVIEARRSIRRYDDRPLTLTELGELLYRAARVRATLGPDPGHGMPYPASDRPYPCGGAGYDLELYLTVRRCDGLEPGSYFYDPLGHQLVLVNAAPLPREKLLHHAYVACAGATVPDVLVTLTARFQRLGWKYRGMAYAATLKHVGVMYQTLYLIATAMGLAPCGLGSGDADLAASAFGLDWTRESSVGEFMLGRRPAAAADDPAPVSAVAGYRPANDPQWVAEGARLIARLAAPNGKEARDDQGSD
jgi:SagB-type dehydrogenase family enzyme